MQLLCGARALLNPIAWPEPFGMVMLEALACGTPVVARAEGAAPEIVGPRDGRLPRPHRRSSSRSDVHQLDRIDRLTCRTWAAQRFSLELMAKRYEEQYLLAVERAAAA